MKVKLLKKVRRRFEVFHYPNKGAFYLKDNSGDSSYSYFLNGSKHNETKQGCLNTMMEILRLQYRKYTRKHKESIIKTKVWRNETP